jgi:hypothetical protein
VMDTELDKIVTEIMQSGFDIAMYGSPFETDEETEKQRNYWYDNYKSEAVQQLITLISNTVNEAKPERMFTSDLHGSELGSWYYKGVNEYRDNLLELLNKKEEK